MAAVVVMLPGLAQVAAAVVDMQKNFWMFLEHLRKQLLSAGRGLRDQQGLMEEQAELRVLVLLLQQPAEPAVYNLLPVTLLAVLAV